MLLSSRADHCAFISEMRSSLRDQASAWIWEREFARGRLASSLIAAAALLCRCDGVRRGVLTVSAVLQCCTNTSGRNAVFVTWGHSCASD